MNSAKYREQITINEIINGGKNATGLTGTPTVKFTEWANVKPISQGRALYYGIVENVQSYEIEMRYYPELIITPQMTITWGYKTLIIHSNINKEAYNDKITITAYARS